LTSTGKLVTVPLLLYSREKKALGRNYFNAALWRNALERAGVEPSRANGCHALRHFYASTALHEGESIKALSEYLGHADPGFTLRTYTHLVEDSSQRTKRAIDTVFGHTTPDDEVDAEDLETDDDPEDESDDD
jgi:integrase